MTGRPRQNECRSAPADRTPHEGAQERPCHPACVACRSTDLGGLGLRFHREADGALLARFPCDPVYRSYPENVHGGHLALLLDAAMGHCLFERGVIAVTGRLNIGFAEPVRIGAFAEVRVAITHQDGELYRVRGEVTQEGRVCVRAEGKFTTAASPTEAGTR